jgi:asparagine synthase (glutamine-hydrolysing)
MWGLAIYDTQRRELFLARDRLGKKQIYIGNTPGHVVFGSEMAIPLQASPEFRRLNKEAIPEFLRHGYLGHGSHAVENVSELAPGHWMLVSRDGRITQRQYWSLSTPSGTSAPATDKQAAETCYELAVDAVRARLVADVPICLMLSSGIDSSLLAHVLARELRVPLHAFTLGYQDRGFDESEDAGKFAGELGLPWHRQHVTGADVARDFAQIVEHGSSLQGNTAQIVYFYVNRMIREAGYKVALNGNGGDELFAGYPTYRATRLHEIYRHVPSALRSGLHAMASHLPASFGRVSFDYKVKKFTELSGTSSLLAHGYWRTMFSPRELRDLLRQDRFPTIDDHTALYERTFGALGARSANVVSLLKSDMQAWLQPMLPWVDNISMAHSVELRLPLLDHRLVSYVYALPDRFLFRGYELKRLMKKMLGGRLSNDVLFRRKRGTHVPLSKWLNAELAPIADDLLSPDSVRGTSLFEPREVSRLLDEHRAGRRDNTFKLWNIVALQAWMRRFSIAVT